MKVPWWAIPALAVIVVTTASVAAAESTIASTKVSLPEEVQLSVPGHAPHVPTAPPSTTTPGTGGSAPADRVVPPSRPVVTQSGSMSPNGGDAAGCPRCHGADRRRTLLWSGARRRCRLGRRNVQRGRSGHRRDHARHAQYDHHDNPAGAPASHDHHHPAASGRRRG